MSDRRPDTWMPLYIGDYLRDTGHLSNAEHGAYLLLLMQAWTRDGILPADHERIRLLSRLSKTEWKRSKDVLLAFFTLADGTYRHKRIDVELDQAHINTEQRRAAGKASAARRSAQRPGNETPNETPNETSTGVQREGQRNAIPSPSPTLKEESKNQQQSVPYLRASEPQRPLIDRDPSTRVIRHATPAAADPPTAWLHLADRLPDGTAKTERDGNGVEQPVCGGYYLQGAAEQVCDAARINAATWRGDWRPLTAWLRDGLQLADIVVAIKRVAARQTYNPPASLAYFDQAVRNDAPLRRLG